MPLVKLKKLNAPTRSEIFDGQPSWKDLASKITQMFNIPSERVRVAYINEGKQTVIITDETQLQWFYKLLDQSSEEIKFVVQDTHLDSANTIASTWSADSNLSYLSNSEDDEFSLCCWVLNTSDDPFLVNIVRNKTVYNLKEAIKKKKEHAFTGIDYDTLKLWKLSPPIPSSEIDAKLRHVQSPDDITGSIKLDPLAKLLEHFTSPAPKHVHIVVIREGLDSIHRPSRKRRRIDEAEFDDTPDPNLAGLYRLFWGAVNSSCFQEHDDVVIPDIRTLSVEDHAPSKFTTSTLPDGIVFPSGMRRFLVTRVYEEFWKLITHDDEEWQAVQDQDVFQFSDPSHTTIIKGQPGIGKTVFLSFVLVRRLQAKLPTVYCNSTEYVHIFDDSGVIKVKLTRGSLISELETNAQCCALVNIGPLVEQPPLQFFPSTRRGRVVIATSPDMGHIKAFSKEWPSTSYCMPTWNWDELYFTSILVRKTPVSLEQKRRLRGAFIKFRGVPRICLSSQSGMETYESSVEDAIINIPSIEELIFSVQGPMPFRDNTSHRLVTIEPISHSWKQTSTQITSDYIARLLFKQFKMHQVSRSITKLLAFPCGRGPAGVLFEQAVHHVFCKGITFTVEGMSTEAPNLEVSISTTDQEDSYFYHLRGTRAETGSRYIGRSYLNRYMIPILKNQYSIDSIWLSKDCTVLFQTTVSKDHPLKSKGIRTLLNELPANAKKDVRIVFVIPFGDKETATFGEQPITSEIGEVTEEIQNYLQYVYRFDYINTLSSNM